MKLTLLISLSFLCERFTQCNKMRLEKNANLRVWQILKEDKTTLNGLKCKTKILIHMVRKVFSSQGLDNSENSNHGL